MSLPIACSACAAAPDLTETCGYPELDRTVLVVERGDTRASLARLSDGCLTEAPTMILLGEDQILLGAHGQPFVGVNDQGALFRVDVEQLELVAPAIDAYADGAGAKSVHGIYGVDADANGDLWVSRDDVASIAVVDRKGSITPVDLSDIDPDGVPDMNGILVQDGKAYVALGFLPPRNTPTETFGDQAKQDGAIAVIDVATKKRVGLLELGSKNPVRAFVPTGDPNVVLIATPGRHDEVSKGDGIARVWLDGSHEAEMLATEEELGGSVEEVVWGSDHEVYAITLGKEPGLNPTKVVVFDPSKPAGERVRELAKAPWFDDPVNGAAYVYSGLVLTEEHVVFGDHTPGAGRIHVVSRATGEEVAAIPTTVGVPWQLLALSP